MDKKTYAPDVKMSEKEYDKLVVLYGKAATRTMIDKLSAYKGARGRRYKSDYKAILCWVVDWAKDKRYIERRDGNGQDERIKTDAETRRIMAELEKRQGG